MVDLLSEKYGQTSIESVCLCLFLLLFLFLFLFFNSMDYGAYLW